MKKSMKRNCVLAAFATLLLASCTTDLRSPDAIFASDAGVKVNFSAVINNQSGSSMTGSRASGTSWDVGDLIGISCGDNQLNIEYQYNSDGTFTAPGGVAEEIWVLGTQVYPVVAYYPFTGDSGTVPDAIAVTTSDALEQTADGRASLDFLFAETEVEAADPNVTLDFHHAMSRIQLQFEAATGYQLSDIQLYLIGLKTEGTFNTQTGEIVADSASVNDIYYSAITAADNYLVEAIVLPQEIENKFYFQAGMNGAYYEVTFDLTELKPGVSYNYTIVADEYSDNPFVLTITNQTQITDWDNLNGGTITPDPSLAGTDANTTASDWNLNSQTIIPTKK